MMFVLGRRRTAAPTGNRGADAYRRASRILESFVFSRLAGWLSNRQTPPFMADGATGLSNGTGRLPRSDTGAHL
jgi:hypothetical protein